MCKTQLLPPDKLTPVHHSGTSQDYMVTHRRSGSTERGHRIYSGVLSETRTVSVTTAPAKPIDAKAGCAAPPFSIYQVTIMQLQ